MTMEKKPPNYWGWIDNFVRFRDLNPVVIRSLKRPFLVVLKQDTNRALDGLEFRNEYEALFDIPALPGECTVLEVLIGLSRRIAFQLGTPAEEEELLLIWFHKLVKNLKLTNRLSTNERLSVWMERTFEADGRGSPFPLKRPNKDQRDVEMWYQMQNYIGEYYNDP